jgi:hypothetical protein
MPLPRFLAGLGQLINTYLLLELIQDLGSPG